MIDGLFVTLGNAYIRERHPLWDWKLWVDHHIESDRYKLGLSMASLFAGITYDIPEEVVRASEKMTPAIVIPFFLACADEAIAESLGYE